MKTITTAALSWIVALVTWIGFIELRGGAIWDSPRDFLIPLVLLGAPLLIIVPLMHLPAMRWVHRRTASASARRLLASTTGVMLSLPLVLWPVIILGGTVRDLTRSVSQEYFVLYAVFGFAFGMLSELSPLAVPSGVDEEPGDHSPVS